MQLNMFLAKPDEALLIGFVRARGGYLARDFEEQGETLVEVSDELQDRIGERLMIFSHDVFPETNLADPRWRSLAQYGSLKTRSQFAGPRIDYQHVVSEPVAQGVVHARLWASFSRVKFYGPPPYAGGPPEGFPNGYANEEEAMDKLYKGLCRDVRKAFVRFGTSPAALWIGPAAVEPVRAAGWAVEV